MKRPNKGGKRIVPPPGGESFQIGEAGPPVYHMPMPGKATRVIPVPMDEWQIGEAGPPMTPEQARAWRASRGVLDPDRPLIPTAAEVASLPREARAAFARRCAARVAPLLGGDGPVELDPAAAARLILAAATVDAPFARHVRRIRRDFDRLTYLARTHHWTDDTPVPLDACGPLWAADATPDWASDPAVRVTSPIPSSA